MSLGINRDTNSWWYFLSKIDKDEYILMNKPSLSLNDLLSVWGGNDMFQHDGSVYKDAPLFLQFKELAKSKINQ